MTEDISIDVGSITKKTSEWFKKNYLLFLILIPIILCVYIRVQTVYLPTIDVAAEQNIKLYIQSTIEQQVQAQYPNLPPENKQALVQQQLDLLYEQGTISYGGQQVPIDTIVEENARQIREQFQDEYGLTYLGEIDPWYFYRLTDNYLEHGYEGDIELNGVYYDTHQLGGTPLESKGGFIKKLPHFHVIVEAYLYKLIHLFIPSVRLMTVVYFLPVLLAALSIIPAFFIVKKVAGNIGGLAAAVYLAVHPAFVGRTIAGFSDTDGYNILFPLLIMWLFVEAIEAESWKKSIILSTIAGLVVGVFSFTWGGWWYIYDFLLGVCFVSVWYICLNDFIAEKQNKLQWVIGGILLAPVVVIAGIVLKIYNVFKTKEWQVEKNITLYTIIIFIISCGIFVSLISSTTMFLNAVKEPMGFTTIKDVGLIKLWPNVLTTVAEFNPASLGEIMGTTAFGISILMLLGFLGIGYGFFERTEIQKDEELIIALTLVWVIGVVLMTSKLTPLLYTLLILVPLAYAIYKQNTFSAVYFVGIPIWYALMIRFLSSFEQHLFLFFILICIPIIVGIIYALLQSKKIDLKYGILLFIWFAGTIYASTQGVRFVMILVPAFSVALGIGIAFVYKLWLDVIAEKIKIPRLYVKIILIAAITVLFFVPVSVGYKTGTQQLPLINDQWYNALQKINSEAAPDAIVNSWWDYGHWFKAITDRAVTFDGGCQDTPQAHWIGKVLLTDNEQEAVAILRMLDCGGNTAYDLIYNATNDSYTSIALTKEIIMQTEEDAVQTLKNHELTEEQAQNVLQYTHCNPPEDYFITSQDMVGKSAVWAHFGSWNFERAYVVNVMNEYDKPTALSLIEEKLEISAEQAIQLYNGAQANDANTWISPWPSYVSMPAGCWQEGTMLFCESGLIFNLTNGDTIVQTSDGYKHPLGLYYIAPDGSFNTKTYTNTSDLLTSTDGNSYSAAIVPDGTGFKGFMMDSLLTKSMFTRLFFFKGHQLECFDLFDYQQTVTGESIYVWNVDWSCSSPNNVFSPDVVTAVDSSEQVNVSEA
ncbi:MAG: STT3 domain-containing protein [Candidatus Woesearchaeota archaeon]|jgi:dolichyl-diphosphooligosaccharide--protein glycosyltransferase